MINSFKQELCDLLSADETRGRIVAAKRRRDRIDELVAIVKEVLLKTSLCYCDDRLSIFDGRLFREVKTEEVENVINNALCDLRVPATISAKVPSLTLKILAEKRVWSKPNLIAFANCIYDLNTTETHAFAPQVASTYSVRYDYSANAKCLHWAEFLDSVLPDKSKQAVLQEFIGMIYIDRTKISIEKCLILIGGGANGKSVVYNILKALVGDRYVSTFRPNQLATDIGVYGTIGKKLNCCSEVQVSDTMTGALKPLISHEPVEGKGLYKEHVQVRCPPIIFILNEFPAMPDNSYGFWRRMLIIEFDITIPKAEQDKALSAKMITTELPGIFNWAMEGRARLLKRNGEFTPSRSIENKVAQTELQSDPILAYFTDMGYSPYPSDDDPQPFFIKAADLIGNFDGLTETQFGREMRRLGFEKVKKGVIMYQVFRKAGH